MTDLLSLAERRRMLLGRIDSRTQKAVIEIYKRASDTIEEQIYQTMRRLEGRGVSISDAIKRVQFLRNRANRIAVDVDLLTRKNLTAAVTEAQNDATQVAAEYVEETFRVSGAAGIAEVSGKPVAQLVKTLSAGGSGVDKTIKGLNDSFRDGLIKTLGTGILLGQSEQQLIKGVRQLQDLTTARARTIARTETFNAFRKTSVAATEGTSFGRWVWVSTLDRRSCLRCWRMHGTISSNKGFLKGHPNCRCVPVPIRYGQNLEELGIEPGPKLFAKLPPEQQREILGPARFDVYAKGDADIVDFVTISVDKDGGVNTAIKPLAKTFKNNRVISLPEQPPIKPIEQKPPAEELETQTGAKPTRKRRARKQTEPVEIEPLPTELSTFELPETLDEIKFIENLGRRDVWLGETRDGHKVVVKRGYAKGQMEAEAAADAFYRAVGVPAPKSKIIRDGKDVAKVAEFIEGTQLGRLTGKARKDALDKFMDGIFADALLGNRDVLGLNLDNVLVSADGRVWRVDNGSVFTFRARGESKEWDNTAQDFVELLRPGRQISGTIGKAEIREAIGRVPANFKRERVLKAALALPDDFHDTMLRRVEDMAIVAERIRHFNEAEWQSAPFILDVLEAGIKMRAAGVFELLSKQLNAFGEVRDNVAVHPKGYRLRDENGVQYDHLEITTERFFNHAAKENPPIEFIVKRSYGAQSVSSTSPYIIPFQWVTLKAKFGDRFSDEVLAKRFFRHWRGAPYTREEINVRMNEALSFFNATREQYEKAIAWHKAFVMELLSRTQIVNKEQNKFVLLRLAKGAGLSEGKNISLRLRPGTSFSLCQFADKTISGGKFRSRVNLADIEMVYLLRANNKSLFAHETENEFVVSPGPSGLLKAERVLESKKEF